MVAWVGLDCNGVYRAGVAVRWLTDQTLESYPWLQTVHWQAGVVKRGTIVGGHGRNLNFEDCRLRDSRIAVLHMRTVVYCGHTPSADMQRTALTSARWLNRPSQPSPSASTGFSSPVRRFAAVPQPLRPRSSSNWRAAALPPTTAPAAVSVTPAAKSDHLDAPQLSPVNPSLILECGSPADVLRLYMSQRARMDVVTATLCLTQVGLAYYRGAVARPADLSSIRSVAMGVLRADLLRHFTAPAAASRLDPRVPVSAMHALARIQGLLRSDALFHAAAVLAVSKLESLPPRSLAMLAHSLADYRSPLLVDRRLPRAGPSLAMRISDACVGGVCATWPPYVPPGAVARAAAVGSTPAAEATAAAGKLQQAALAVFRSPWEPTELIMLAEAYAAAGETSPLPFDRLVAAATPLVAFSSSIDLVNLARALTAGRRGAATERTSQLLVLLGEECAARMESQAAISEASAAGVRAGGVSVRAGDGDVNGASGLQWQQRLSEAFLRAGLGTPGGSGSNTSSS